MYRVELTGNGGLARFAGLPGHGGDFSCQPDAAVAKTWMPRLIGVLAVLIAGLGGWMLLSDYGSDPAGPMHLATAAVIEPLQPSNLENIEEGSLPNPAAAPAEAVPPEAAPVNGLKISSQSWRRGGLGSKALVTLTLRNGNDYAVKDIEIFCSFTRRDGSHLTDRRRLIQETINMKSRKTFARMHVGFVNINANQAKCSLVTASRI
jgi:hypothetical protein